MTIGRWVGVTLLVVGCAPQRPPVAPSEAEAQYRSALDKRPPRPRRTPTPAERLAMACSVSMDLHPCELAEVGDQAECLEECQWRGMVMQGAQVEYAAQTCAERSIALERDKPVSCDAEFDFKRPVALDIPGMKTACAR